MCMSAESELEKSITAANAEQVHRALSALLDAELADRDLDEDTNPAPVVVDVDDVSKACPVPEEKCRALLEQFAADPGSGIDQEGYDSYAIDPTVRAVSQATSAYIPSQITRRAFSESSSPQRMNPEKPTTES